MTEAQKMRNKRSYQKRVNEKRCVCCGKQDDRTLSGLRYCLECRDRHRANEGPRKPLTEAQREEANANKREWRRKLMSLHACSVCGTKDKRTTVYGYELCARCSAKKRQWYQEHKDLEKGRAYAKERRDRWREHGLCTYCGGPKEDHGMMLCVNCRVRTRMNRIRKKTDMEARKNGCIQNGV